MEEIIKRVLSIDKNACEILKQADEYIKTTGKDAEDKIAAMKTEAMDRAKNDSEALYRSMVGEAETEAGKIKKETAEKVGSIREEYLKVKDKLEAQLFERIFD